ncbi:MAG: alpha/beta fold hydrolase, partial [Candidatus Limnocylindrales bacterium]
MIDPLRRAASRWPDAPALSDASTSLTWSGVLHDANELAVSMRIEPGTRVGLLSGDGARTVVAIHAVRLAGGVLVPLHRRLAVPELRRLLAGGRVGVLAHDAAHAGTASDLSGGTAIRLRSIDDPSPEGSDEASAVRELRPDGVGAVVHTSGTTSTPRGVVLSSGALLASATAWNTFLGSGPTDHWLSVLPLSHVAGLGMVLRPMLSGARLTIHERFEPDRVRAAIERDRITLLSVVPAQLQRLLESGPVAPGVLRALLLGGAPAPAGLVRTALEAGLPVVTTYGLTEAGSGVTALPADETSEAPGSAGRPLPGIRLRVTDGMGGDIPLGAVGRILVGGPTLACGYDGDPDATDAAFVDGWLWTRDLGSLDERGRLWVADRMDDLIITGGENVSPAEVEGVLASHPAIAGVAVVGRPDPAWGSVPVAAVVARDGLPAPTLEELRSFARPHLAGYKLPADVRAVEDIPRTPSGKVIRREVAALVAAAAPTELEVPRPDGALVHVEVRGSGPVVVLLHATLSNARELRPLAERLAARFRVLSVDRRSAGGSHMPADDPGGPVDVALHIADIQAVLEQAAPGERVLVVGHSFGGCVALELAARAPGPVAGAWVFEPPYLTLLPANATPDLARLGDRITALAREAGPRAAALAFLDAVRGPGTGDRLPLEARDRLAAEGRAAAADAALLGFAPGDLPRITVPVVVGLGGRGGPYEAVASALATQVPDHTNKHNSQHTHPPPETRPQHPPPTNNP